MIKTVGEWIEYYLERYGRLYRVRIENQDVGSFTYHYWEFRKIPKDVLALPAKRAWSRNRTDEYGIIDRELVITY